MAIQKANELDELLASIADDDPILLKVMDMAQSAAHTKQGRQPSISRNSSVEGPFVAHSRSASNMGRVDKISESGSTSDELYLTHDDSANNRSSLYINEDKDHSFVSRSHDYEDESESDTEMTSNVNADEQLSAATKARVQRCKELLEAHFGHMFRAIERMEYQWDELLKTGVVEGCLNEHLESVGPAKQSHLAKFVHKFAKGDTIKPQSRPLLDTRQHALSLRKPSLLLLGVGSKNDSATMLAMQAAEQSIARLQWNPLAIIRWRRTMWQKAVKANHFEEIRKWKPKPFSWDLNNWEIEAYETEVLSSSIPQGKQITGEVEDASPSSVHPSLSATSAVSAASMAPSGSAIKLSDGSEVTSPAKLLNSHTGVNREANALAGDTASEKTFSNKSTPTIAVSRPTSPELTKNQREQVSSLSSSPARKFSFSTDQGPSLSTSMLVPRLPFTKFQSRSLSPSLQSTSPGGATTTGVSFQGVNDSSSRAGIPSNFGSSTNSSSASFKDDPFGPRSPAVFDDSFLLSPRSAKLKRRFSHRKTQSLQVSPATLASGTSPLGGSPLVESDPQASNNNPNIGESFTSAQNSYPAHDTQKFFNKSLGGFSTSIGDAAHGAYGTLSRAARDTKDFLSNSTASKSIKTSVAKAVKKTTPQMRRFKQFVQSSNEHGDSFATGNSALYGSGSSAGSKLFGRGHRRTLSEMPRGHFDVDASRAESYFENNSSMPSSPQGNLFYERDDGSMTHLPPLPIDLEAEDDFTVFRLTRDERLVALTTVVVRERLEGIWEMDNALLNKTKELLTPVQLVLEKSDYRLGWMSSKAFTLISRTGVLNTSDFLQSVQLLDLRESQLKKQISLLETDTIAKEEKVVDLLAHVDRLTEILNQTYFQQLCEIHDAFHELDELSRRSSYVRWAQELLYSSLAGLLSLAGSFIWFCFQIFKASRWTSTSIWTLFRAPLPASES